MSLEIQTDFNNNEMFCRKCLIHDTFFNGGGSWIIDTCPNCSGFATILWSDLSITEKIKAKRIFQTMWTKKWKLNSSI